MNITNLVKEFEENISKELSSYNIKIEKDWVIDHLCYRVSSEESYRSFKTIFAKMGELLIESLVGGRLIATYKLHHPVNFMGQKVGVIELPAPKKGKVTIEGFEHFEIVTNLPFSEIKKRYVNCKFDESGLLKDFNKELEIELGKYAIKFHHQSLERVIEVEKGAN